tara:strand:- start:3682 stop:4050 length:369 start_codon:yes stop_codon:yes gene_type:complete
METNKSTNKKEFKPCSFSVKEDIHETYMGVLSEINGMGAEHKRSLKKLTINDLLECMATHLDEKFKGQLKSMRLTGQAKMELYRKRYEDLSGNVSDDQWADIVMSPEFQKFKKENTDCLSIF